MAGISVPNLADPATYANNDVHELWHMLRSDDPVHWHPRTRLGPGFWVLTTYADVLAVLRYDAQFTSEKGNVLASMLQGGDTGAGRMLAVTDGTRHTELRKLLLKAINPRALIAVGRHIRQQVRRLLTEATERGECDFAEDVASVIPLETICDLLDLPSGDRAEMLRLTKSALASEEEIPDFSGERMSRNEILLYFSDLVQDRRKNPGPDLVSLMTAAEIGGERLDDEDIILNCYSLIVGGDETSRLAMIGALQAMMENPPQWRALKTGAVSVQSASEEVLRWTTPTMHFGRVATVDVAVRDRTIRAGDLVTLWLASANQDEAEFTDPGLFDLARSPNRHVAFGHGRHFCLGSYLGRLEIAAMLDGLRTFVAQAEPTGPRRHIYSNFLQGYSSLPVTLTGEPAAQSRWED